MNRLLIATALLIGLASPALAGNRDPGSDETTQLNLNYNNQRNSQSQHQYQGQAQGQTQGIYGSGNSRNRNTNTNNNTATGGNAESNNANNVDVDAGNHTGTIPVSTAWAAPVYPAQDTCSTANSVGAQGLLFGASVSLSNTESGCELRAKMRTLQGMGPKYELVAAKLGCFDGQMAQALNAIYPNFCQAPK